MDRATLTELKDNLRHRWGNLPPSVRTPQQLAGVGGIACGATHGVMEKCNFACTSCYLSDVANHTEPLPFAEVKAQLDTLRDYLGPGGKAQITSGEVTLLDKHDLGRIVAYARYIGLDPMVMTNGQRFLQDEDYLPTLVRDYGLRKVSFHIDVTQKGRKGMQPSPALRERDIHWIRDRFARLVRDVRRQTGKRLHAAHTVTMTNQTLDDGPDIVAWALDNLDGFRLISFLPVAEVGRTKDRRIRDLTLDSVWERIGAGIGKPLNRHAMHFGHTECNITVPVVVLSRGGAHHVIEVVREGRPWDLSIFRRLLRSVSTAIDLDDGVCINGWRIFKALLRRPWMFLEIPLYALYRAWGERRALASPLRFRKVRIRPLLLVVHRFMSADELETPLGRERLEACVFKLPVNGRMVSMCEMNATDLRLQLNLRQLNGRSCRSAASRTATAAPAQA